MQLACRVLARTYEGEPRRAYKASIIRKVGFIVVDELLEHTHLLQDVDGRGAHLKLCA